MAELSVPMLVVAPAQQDAANPEVVRLVALARAGDRAAFGRLIEDHLTAARRVALAAVGQIMDADEAVQEASVTAWQRLDALQEPAAFRGWFMRIVWRKALDRRRSLRALLRRVVGLDDGVHGVASEPAAPGPGIEAVAIEAEMARAAARIVRTLPRRLRDPFLLAASGDHRYEEIALLLDVPVGTVKWRVSEARRLSRAKLERLGWGGRR